MEKTFREELNRFRKEDFKLWQIIVASEIDAYGLEITEGDFEVICSFCYDLVLDTDYDPNLIVRVVVDLLNNNRIMTVDLVNNFSAVEELVLQKISDEV